MVKQVRSKSKQSAITAKPAGLPQSSSSLKKQLGELIELWPAQDLAKNFVLERDASALFFEQRTGKTFITMKVLDEMPAQDLAVVLVAFLGNKESTWADKLQQYLPWLNVTSDWDTFKALPFPKLFLIHFETLHTYAAKLKNAAKTWLNFAIIDEAHKLKARGSRVSRAAARLSSVRKRLILTGTPMDKQPKDLWAQFRFLLPSLFGTWKEFEERFMDVKKISMEGVMKGSARWQVKIMQQGMLRSRAPFKKELMPQFLKLIKPYALRLEKEEVGIKRAKLIKVSVPISGEQQRVYRDMKKHSVVHLGDGRRAMAPLTVTNIIKRRQIASGFIYDDDGECIHVGTAKLDKLVRLFHRLPKPIAVFAMFRPEIDLISETLKREGYEIATVDGRTKKKARPDIWRSFQKAQLDGVVCQIRTGGVGVDMWKSSSGIVHSIGYSWIDFDQMTSRLDAIGKETSAKIYILCGAATIDEDLYDMVVVKNLDANEVLKQLKKGSK